MCMSQEGFEKNVASLSSGGLLIWDTDLVETGDVEAHWTAYHIPATRFAEKLGNKMMANIVMLGFLSALSDARPAGLPAPGRSQFRTGQDQGHECNGI